MLNELLIVERGARQAGLEMVQRHADVKDAGGKVTLLVKLDPKGLVTSVRPVPADVKPWTLRNGQHNSFPFVQLTLPLWDISDEHEGLRKIALDKKSDGRRVVLLELGCKSDFRAGGFKDWPGQGLIDSLNNRFEQLKVLQDTEAAVVPATIERFLYVCSQNDEDGPLRLLRDVTIGILRNLERSAQDHWLEIAVALLIGKKDKDRWKCDGAMLIEADGYSNSIYDQSLIVPVSQALQRRQGEYDECLQSGVCGLTGLLRPLLSGNFPQPTLPAGLGQTWLYAKNREIPANDRYGRFSVEAMPVGQETACRLDGALRALTSPERKNKTWRAIPSEAPKQNDLLLAFVDEAIDAPVAGALAEEKSEEEDFSMEASTATSESVNSVAEFEKRTERLIEMIRAKLSGDVSKTPVRLIVVRKVDPANRKVVYSGSPTVANLEDAAKAWSAGERNVPPWLELPVYIKNIKKSLLLSPPHVAPLGLIAFSKKVFFRGGIEHKDVTGLSAAEALRLFLSPREVGNIVAQRRVGRVLRLLLVRRTSLITGLAHALRRGFDDLKEYDRNEALRTITTIGILLHKKGRIKEVYMNDTAFKLGQLLAAADVVHAGYCADVRGGDVPPSLLGNQVFTMAQSTPAKALATLCRRWKPYEGWADKAVRDPKRADGLITSKQKDERQRGWDIKKALRHAREMKPLAAVLARALDDCRVDDTFRAELLLGYIAGLPKGQQDNSQEDVQEQIQ